MIQAAFKSQLGIIVKNISLAAVLVLGLSQTAKADEANKHQDLRISCDPAINQDSRLNCSFNNLPPEVEQNADTVAQGGRGRRRKSKVQGYYGGFSLGIISPSGGINSSDTPGLEDISEIDYSTGFAGSVFGGIKFNKSIAAELEFLLGLGSGDTDGFNDDFQAAFQPLRDLADNTPGLDVDGDFEIDADYSAFAIYASPRFDLPVSDKFSVFISPGIGLSQTNVNVETDSDLNISSTVQDDDIDEANAVFEQANFDVDESTTGVSFKIKGGAQFQISNGIAIFGQASYVTLPVSDDSNLDNLNSFLGQAGLTFNF